MSRLMSFVVLIGVIAVVGFLFYRVMAGFLLPLFGAAVLVVIFHPVYRWMLANALLMRGLLILGLLIRGLLMLGWLAVGWLVG